MLEERCSVLATDIYILKRLENSGRRVAAVSEPPKEFDEEWINELVR